MFIRCQLYLRGQTLWNILKIQSLLENYTYIKQLFHSYPVTSASWYVPVATWFMSQRLRTYYRKTSIIKKKRDLFEIFLCRRNGPFVWRCSTLFIRFHLFNGTYMTESCLHVCSLCQQFFGNPRYRMVRLAVSQLRGAKTRPFIPLLKHKLFSAESLSMLLLLLLLLPDPSHLVARLRGSHH